MKITKTSDQSQRRLTALIIGDPGIGKTTLTTTLPVDDDARVVYIGVDPGQMALRKRDFTMLQPDADKVWSKDFLRELYVYIKQACANGEYDWVVVDGLDEIGEVVLAEELKTNRDGRKAYGEMADWTKKWVIAMRDIRSANIVFITHVSSSQDDSQRLRFGPSFPGAKLTEKLPDLFDLVGFMRIVKNEGQSAHRMIQFRPEADDRYWCVKDRSGALDDFEGPNLGDIFDKIHAKYGPIKKETERIDDVLPPAADSEADLADKPTWWNDAAPAKRRLLAETLEGVFGNRETAKAALETLTGETSTAKLNVGALNDVLTLIDPDSHIADEILVIVEKSATAKESRKSATITDADIPA